MGLSLSCACAKRGVSMSPATNNMAERHLILMAADVV
jgi:hypothetical protein